MRQETYARSPTISSTIVRNDALEVGIEGSATQANRERPSFAMTTMRIESNREPRSSILAIPSDGSQPRCDLSRAPACDAFLTPPGSANKGRCRRIEWVMDRLLEGEEAVLHLRVRT